MSINKEATRTYSDIHEKSVCKALGGKQTSNSGASRFQKGDVVIDDIMLVECKTTMSEKSSISIKKDWILKNEEERRLQRIANGCVCFNFEPNGKNYYVIDENLMSFLVEKLQENFS